MTYLDLFDTVTVISCYTDAAEEFPSQADIIHDALLEYHQLLDIYNDYEGLNNLKTVNDNAGVAAVEVDERVIDLLLDCKTYYEVTGGAVNVAMGSVLRLWHEAREHTLTDPDDPVLPDMALLLTAAEHCGWDTVEINEQAGTVFITDPLQSLDVGAIAKGWALQRVAQELPSGILISLGGNVCVTGPKNEINEPWSIGVNDPSCGTEYLCILSMNTGSAVTSGDYQRFFTVDGVDYHHIIDPETLMPSVFWSSVTILCEDSGVADMLSTVLFLTTQERGQTLLDEYNAEAMWVDPQGNCYYSAGFTDYIRG